MSIIFYRKLPYNEQAITDKPGNRFDVVYNDIIFRKFTDNKKRAELTLKLTPLTNNNNEVASILIGMLVAHDESKIDINESTSDKSCDEVKSCLLHEVFNYEDSPLIVRGGAPPINKHIFFEIPNNVSVIRLWWIFYQREVSDTETCVINKEVPIPSGGLPILRTIAGSGKYTEKKCFLAKDYMTVAVPSNI